MQPEPDTQTQNNLTVSYYVTESKLFNKPRRQMFTFSRTELVLDIPDAPYKNTAPTPSLLAAKGFLDSCAAALKQIDEAEEKMRPIRTLLRMRRNEYNKMQLALDERREYRPFDLLPDELVVEVFIRALAGPHGRLNGDTPQGRFSDGGGPLTRISLSHVCPRWKAILESAVCISMPDVHPIAVTGRSLVSGALVNQIYSMSRFPGPLHLSLACRVPFHHETWTPPKDILSHLRSLSTALGASHRATISLELQHFPLDLLECMTMDMGYQLFPRIASLSILFASASTSSHLTRILETLPMQFQVPRFPLLSHVTLNLLDSPSIRSDKWKWLLHGTVCNNLLSFTGYHVHQDDLGWILGRTPRLMDLKLKDMGKYAPSIGRHGTISHQNVQQLTLGWDYSTATIKCPRLERLISPDTSTVQDWEITPESLTNLTALTIGCKMFTVVPSLQMAASASVTRLCLIDINKTGLAHLAEACASSAMPLLTALYLQYTSWTHLEDPDPDPAAESDSELSEFSLGLETFSSFGGVLTSLKMISQAPSLEIIDFRVHLSPFRIRSRLLDMVRRLRYVVDESPDVLGDSSESEYYTDSEDAWLDIDTDFESIEDILHVEGECPLEELSEAWTTFVTQNQKRVINGSNPPAYELWTAFPTFRSVVERLRYHFAGTSFPLHEDIINGWKRGSRSSREKEWMIGVSPALADGVCDPVPCISGYRFEGLFYGRQHGSLIYDLRREDHLYYSMDSDIPRSDHEISEAVGGISKLMLRQLGFPSYL